MIDEPDMERSPVLEAMRANEVDQVVDIHMRAFPGFFLTFLGPAFLRQFYAGVLESPSGIALVGRLEGQICGFVAGSTAPAGFYRRLLRRRGWRFALAALGPMFRNPGILPRLLRALTRTSEGKGRSGAGTLMSIAVMPEAQGSGLGQALVLAFLARSASAGVTTVSLSTDSEDNQRVNDFYQALGFVLDHIYLTPEGRKMNEYLFDLDDLPKYAPSGAK